MWAIMKLRGICINLFIVMLAACSLTTDSEENSLVQSEDKEKINLNQQLISAVTEGNIETILELLNVGADINATDNHGVTAVMAATQRNNVNIVKALIEQGANIDIQNHHQDNVLLFAGAEGLLDILKLAIEAGADTTLTNRKIIS